MSIQYSIFKLNLNFVNLIINLLENNKNESLLGGKHTHKSMKLSESGDDAEKTN